MSRQRTIAACHKSVADEINERAFTRVPLPVDCTDEEQFPEIARAIAWAKQRQDR